MAYKAIFALQTQKNSYVDVQEVLCFESSTGFIVACHVTGHVTSKDRLCSIYIVVYCQKVILIKYYYANNRF